MHSGRIVEVAQTAAAHCTHTFRIGFDLNRLIVFVGCKCGVERGIVRIVYGISPCRIRRKCLIPMHKTITIVRVGSDAYLTFERHGFVVRWCEIAHGRVVGFGLDMILFRLEISRNGSILSRHLVGERVLIGTIAPIDKAVTLSRRGGQHGIRTKLHGTARRYRTATRHIHSRSYRKFGLGEMSHHRNILRRYVVGERIGGSNSIGADSPTSKFVTGNRQGR